MKRIALLCLSLLFAGWAYSQCYITYTFTYDDAGNRTGRTYELSCPNQKTAAEQSLLDSLNQSIDPQAKAYPDRLGDMQLNLYPNPTMGEFVIEVVQNTQNAQAIEYALYDLAGKQVWHTTSSERFTPVDITEQAAGQYILRLTVGEHTKTYQVIKQ